MKISILGAGAWGTALAQHLSDGKNEVTLWGRDIGHLMELENFRQNKHYLPGIELPSSLKFQSELTLAVPGAEVIVMAVPSKAFREISRALVDFSGIVVSVTKGLEHESGLTMCGILNEAVPSAQASALSGPSLRTTWSWDCSRSPSASRGRSGSTYPSSCST